jgi:hypothetical protein
VGVSKKCDAQKQVRLDDDLYESLSRIKDKCPWPSSLTVLANYSMRLGLARTRRTFNPASGKNPK